MSVRTGSIQIGIPGFKFAYGYHRVFHALVVTIPHDFVSVSSHVVAKAVITCVAVADAIALGGLAGAGLLLRKGLLLMVVNTYAGSTLAAAAV